MKKVIHKGKKYKLTIYIGFYRILCITGLGVIGI